MSANPVDKLELQALLQRDQVHETIGELKEKVDAARAKLDVRTNAREHLLGASLIVSSLAFFAGYGLAGLFTRS
ncbi:MAG: hypothetical protein WAL52_05975 [Candidatus Sulfotelmatobacter sp.]